MVYLSDIYNALDNVGAGLNIWNNPNNNVVTIEMQQQYEIFINTDKCPTIAELKEKLMHEYGHCKTGCTHSIYSPHELIAKNEYKANRCSYEHFLPWEEIKKAAQDGRSEYWQLADYFDLPEQYIRAAVKYYKENRGYSF